ncbi:MAG: GNAT family N-acetyltransferase [Acidobacteriaceae bacterium]
MLRGLITRVGSLGKHTMIAGVNSENTASFRFLERFGFERVAHFREVGYKFNRFLDLLFLPFHSRADAVTSTIKRAFPTAGG